MLSKTTDIDLVNVLIKRNTDGKYHDIIERARKKGYHDFKCEDEYPDCVCPKVDLVHDLSKFPELQDIRNDVVNGEYDESPDDDDKRKMEEDMPFLKQMFNK